MLPFIFPEATQFLSIQTSNWVKNEATWKANVRSQINLLGDFQNCICPFSFPFPSRANSFRQKKALVYAKNIIIGSRHIARGNLL